MNKFDIKDELDRFIYRVYNFLSDILFSLNFEAKRLVKKNARLKDIHKNERCFILGTGPSLALLTGSQLDKLKSEVLFGVNSFYKADIASVLTPKYYALLDEQYWNNWSSAFGEVVRMFPDSPPIFITDPRAQGIIELLKLTEPSIYIYAKKYPANKVSDEIAGNAYITMNVVGSCILVAAYMGFKEINLLGCDYNAFCSAGRGHCYDDEKDLADYSYNLAFFLKYYWITTEFHYLIAKLAKTKGIRVVNLTHTSLLDAYPRVPTCDVL